MLLVNQMQMQSSQKIIISYFIFILELINLFVIWGANYYEQRKFTTLQENLKSSPGRITHPIW